MGVECVWSDSEVLNITLEYKVGKNISKRRATPLILDEKVRASVRQTERFKLAPFLVLSAIYVLLI